MLRVLPTHLNTLDLPGFCVLSVPLKHTAHKLPLNCYIAIIKMGGDKVAIVSGASGVQVCHICLLVFAIVR